MKSKWMAMVAVLALGSACSDSHKQDGPEQEPNPVTFRLVNGDSTPVFAYLSAGAATKCSRGQFVEVLDDSVSRPLRTTCHDCSCELDDYCLTCSAQCAVGTEEQNTVLGAGESRTFNWQGQFQNRQTHDLGFTCYQPEVPTGDTLTARFCWGTRFETTGPEVGEIADIVCEDVEFSIDDSDVEYVIQPSVTE